MIINRRFNKYIVMILSIIVLIFIAGLIYISYYFDRTIQVPVTLGIKDQSIEIIGFNNELSIGKVDIPIDSVRKIDYKEGPVQIMNNNFNRDSANKIYGKEDVQGLGKVYCYIENDDNPYIYIKTDSNNYIVNLKNKNATLKQYKFIKNYKFNN